MDLGAAGPTGRAADPGSEEEPLGRTSSAEGEVSPREAAHPQHVYRRSLARYAFFGEQRASH
jgi:hypothetical protein